MLFRAEEPQEENISQKRMEELVLFFSVNV